PEDALRDLGQSLERTAGGLDAAGDRIRRGRILEGLGRHAEALEEYDEALTDLPDDRSLARFSDELAGVHRFRARCLRELGSTGDALGALDRHLAVRPRDAGAYRARGLLKEKRGDVRGAINDYTSALGLRPDATPLVRRGWARLGSGDPRLAATDFEEARRLDGKNAEALLGHGYASLKLGDRRRAEADVEKAFALQLKDT